MNELTEEEKKVLAAKPTEEPDKGEVKWPKEEWKKPKTNTWLTEPSLHHFVEQQNPAWISLDSNRPDYWDGEKFVEIKRATVEQTGQFNVLSTYFLDLFFPTDVDKQINRYPRPLLVIVFDAHSFTPKEIARRVFPRNV